MAKEVVLTPIAEEDFNNVIDYLTYEWGVAVTNDFVDRFAQVINCFQKILGSSHFSIKINGCNVA
jgi:plasmid stabilization system protein ParE